MLINQGFLIKGKEPEGLKILLEVPENLTYYIYAIGKMEGVVVDWGDGITKRYLDAKSLKHTYVKAGEYTLHIWGEFEEWKKYQHQTFYEKKVLLMGNDFKVKNQKGVFGNCKNLTTVNFSGYQHFNTMNFMFWSSPNIESVILEDTNLDSVTSTSSMFYELGENMTDFSFLSDFKNVTNVGGMFYNSQSKHIDLSHFDMSKVESISGMFRQCKNLEQITFPNKPWQAATNCGYFAFKSTQIKSEMPRELFWNKSPRFTDYKKAFEGAVNIKNYSSIPANWKE